MVFESKNLKPKLMTLYHDRSRLQTTRNLRFGNAWQMHTADALGPHVLPKQDTANLELFLKSCEKAVTVPTQRISYWLSEFHLKNLR